MRFLGRTRHRRHDLPGQAPCPHAPVKAAGPVTSVAAASAGCRLHTTIGLSSQPIGYCMERRSSPLPSQTRVLGRADVPQLRAMLALFGEAFEDPARYTGRQPDDAYLARLLGSDTFLAVAAFDGTSLAGGLAGYVLHKFEQARTEFYIYDLAVAERFRRRGFATAMIRRLQAETHRRGIDGIFVQADLGDDPAIALYDRLGARAEVLHFDIPSAPAP